LESSRRRTLLAGGCVVTLLALAACRGTRPHPSATARPRDLILITVDTLRADRVGVDGGPPDLTPALDNLGRSGVVFLDATSHAPLTLPSHTSILTGLYPVSHGVHDNAGFALSDNVPTLATVLRGAGYHTAAFVSSYVLRGSTGLARGFEVYDDRFEGVGRSHVTLSSLERRAPDVARTAAGWLRSTPPPRFLWVHFYDPHAPYDPPAAFAAKYAGRPYDGEVATADFGVSTLLAAPTPEQRRDTVIVATGDHGESLGEHGESEHGVLLYDATLHVPLIIQGAGVPVGVTVRRQARHVDILPTVLALLNVNGPARLDGVDVLALLGSDREQIGVRPRSGRPSDPAVSYAESRFGELHFGWSPIRSARDGTWKYIDAPAPELYNLAADPGERDNREQDRASTASGLARVLGEIVARGAAPTRASAPNADASERLRSLGYIGTTIALDHAGKPPGTVADPKKEIARYETYVRTFNDGMALLDAHRAAEGEATFRRLARAFPRSFEAHQYLGRALAARGSSAAAVDEFDLAISLAPREAVLYFDAGKTLADASRYDAAFDRVAAGLALESSSFDGWLTRGLVARAAGQHDAAEQAYREALRLNPALGVAHLELGRLAEMRGDRAAARIEYRRALDVDSTLTDARLALGRVAR
jgi:choline-sulfatase